MVCIGRDVEYYATKVSNEGERAWNQSSIPNLGDLGDGELLRLYVDAKSKAEEFSKAHQKFLAYVDSSDKYDFQSG